MRNSPYRSLALFLTWPLFGQVNVTAVVQYTFEEVDLGFLPHAMNNRGWIVGCTEIPERPMRYRPGVGTEQISQSRGCLNDINDAGTAVGYLIDGTGKQEAIMRPAGEPWKRIGTFGGSMSTANAINEAGQVTGYFDQSPHGSGQYRAYIYTEAAGMTPLTDFYSHGYAINESGQITGNIIGVHGNGGFLWDATHGLIELQPLIGLEEGYLAYSAGIGIADNGTIALQNDKFATFSLAQGFRKIGALGPRGWAMSKAINDRGWMAGWNLDRDLHFNVAVLYVYGQGIRDLNTLTPGIPVQLADAQDINDRDQILAAGGIPRRYFVLSRVP